MQLKEILCAFGPLKAFRLEEDKSTRPWKVYAFVEVRSSIHLQVD